MTNEYGLGSGSSAISNWRAMPANERLLRDFSDPDYDDSDWHPIDVPSHWQTHPEFADFDGTLLYRADFTVPAIQPGQRRWLRFNGICYAGDVFLDGAYIGQTEGYFTHHRFEVTDVVAKSSTSVLAVEVRAPSTEASDDQRDLTGWFTHGPGLAPNWNPAGLWRPVVVVDTGPVAIRHFRVLCTSADTANAQILLRAVLLASEPGHVKLTTEVAGVTHTDSHAVAAGENQVEWTIDIPNPELWWPTGLGEQPLFDVNVTARTANGDVTDRKHRRIGFRTTAMNDFILRINNRRTFLRGINLSVLRSDMAALTADEIKAEATAIRDAGFNLVRVRSHVTRHEFIDAADELGLLVWQDLPLFGPYARSVTAAAEQQTRDMVDLLSHHPSIVIWGGHSRPHTSAARTTAAPDLRQQQLPSWNRTVLDRAVRRAFERADPSRPIIAHSDVGPHVPQLSGSDLSLYFGWFDSVVEDIAEYAATLPRLVRFVSDMGSQSLPSRPENLEAELEVTGANPDVLRRVIPPTTYEDVDAWAAASQAHQGDVLKAMIETLRVLKYRPVGGYCAGIWRNAQSGLSRALVNADGTPRLALDVVTAAQAPVQPVLYPTTSHIPARTSTSLALFVGNDLPTDFDDAVISASVTDHRGTKTQQWRGNLAADETQFIADITVRGGRIGAEASVHIVVTIPGLGPITNSYSFVAS